MISLRGVGKSFGAHRVLADINLDVRAGEVVSLIGPSGSGKTTLLRCMNFLEAYDEGEVRIRGALLGYRKTPAGQLVRETERSIAEVRVPVAMVFQQFNLWPHMTVLANVTAPLTLAKGMPADQARTVALQALDRVGMAAKADAMPAALSAAPRNRLPPPMTRPTCTPIPTSCPTSRAMRSSTFGSIPKSSEPIRASPLSLSKMRL